MSETLFLPAMRDDGETEVFVEFTVHSWGSPPQTYGPPEMCDPGDPIEAEITDCWIAGDSRGEHAPRIKLTDAECERILDKFYANPPEPDYGPDPDDERDGRYDEDRP